MNIYLIEVFVARQSPSNMRGLRTLVNFEEKKRLLMFYNETEKTKL
jgi:hypothetical protein